MADSIASLLSFDNISIAACEACCLCGHVTSLLISFVCTVIDTITSPGEDNAGAIPAGPLYIGAATANLVSQVSTIVSVVAAPRVRDTRAVVTPEL